jgi:hypothetical protein
MNSCGLKQIERHGVGKLIRTIESTASSIYSNQEQKTRGYSHPHSAPQRISMSNHKLEHHQSRINIVSPIVSEAVVVEN